AARREKVDDFYAARTVNTTALPWSNFAPPFSSSDRQASRFFGMVSLLCAGHTKQSTFQTQQTRNASHSTGDQWMCKL
ncbi:hypothetical protein, partial [Celeribacter persicus]|uniref:hypothetical protein n=1 Tax=Celeribacter persicus TaxID=1651082 RepID=UPI001B864851